MTKKNTNINQYAVHYKSERPQSKKPKHGSRIKPVVSKRKHGKMIEENEQPEREASDGSTDVILFIAGVMALFGTFYAVAKALNLF